MNLPGSSRTHVWLGLLLALVGVLVGGYAYTGERVYHIEFIGVAFLGFILLLVGSTLAGWGQANRPRLGGNPRNKDDDEDDSRSLSQRVKALLTRGDADEGVGGRVETTLACPSCDAVFEASGTPPFEATCPECGHEDTVEVPEPRPPG